MNKIAIVFLLYSAITLTACGGKQRNEPSSTKLSYQDKIKIKQYVSQGRKLYNQNCANCHQVNGEGLANLYPPLKDSDYLMNDVEASICFVKNGLKGEITVNGKVFNQEMPANGIMTDLELAEILTYVVNEFNDREMLISQKEVRRVLKNCPE